MNQLTIVLTGKKQSGKNTTCNYIAAKYLNKFAPDLYYYNVNDRGELCFGEHVLIGENAEVASLDEYFEERNIPADVKIYSFADALKEICMNVFGATYEQCYGTDAQKNSPIPHLSWENVPGELKPYTTEYVKVDEGQLWPGYEKRTYKSGAMTGRDLMQWLGTDVCRRLYGDCWAKATYKKVKAEKRKLALICDGRFPNEISNGADVNAKTIRLARQMNDDGHVSETALDNYPRDGYTLYIDNQNMSVEQQCAFLDPYIDRWFEEAGFVEEPN